MMNSKQSKNIFHKIKYLLLSFCLLLLLGSCISMVEKTGRFLDGSNEKVLERYSCDQGIEVYRVRNRKKEESIFIALKKYPMIKLRGSIPEENGVFILSSFEYLGGNDQGWNEYFMDILGSGRFIAGDPAVLSITEKIETVQISGGRIHRRDTRLTGEEAATALRNRHVRILSLVEWMSGETQKRQFGSMNDFEEYWKPILFPEQVSKRKRPENWQHPDDVFQRAESIRWNTSYTERVFPENLRPIRDSGTLLRDWEETLSWIYIEYEWDNIIELLSGNTILKKIK